MSFKLIFWSLCSVIGEVGSIRPHHIIPIRPSFEKRNQDWQEHQLPVPADILIYTLGMGVMRKEIAFLKNKP